MAKVNNPYQPVFVDELRACAKFLLLRFPSWAHADDVGSVHTLLPSTREFLSLTLISTVCRHFQCDGLVHSADTAVSEHKVFELNEHFCPRRGAICTVVSWTRSYWREFLKYIPSEFTTNDCLLRLFYWQCPSIPQTEKNAKEKQIKELEEAGRWWSWAAAS